MDRKRVLQRLFHKLKRDEVEKILRAKGMLPEKFKRKGELEKAFLALANLIKPEEFNSFVERAVLKKMKGLPAYTHKLKSILSLINMTNADLKKFFSRQDKSISEIYNVSTEFIKKEANVIETLFIVKVFEESWRNGKKSLESLSAIYSCKVNFNLQKNVLTIFTGEDEIHGVIATFIAQTMQLPIETYRIKNSSSTLTWDDSASYKTALFLDLIYNRLKKQNLKATFKEIKFKVGNNDIKDVTINGVNILTSYLACEYVSLGKDIVHFKIALSYNRNDLSCSFSLKGKANDILKIVVVDSQDEKVKAEVMELIQDEYISMCEDGIHDLDSVKKQLKEINLRFIQKDGSIVEVMQENIMTSINIFGELLADLDLSNDEAVERVEKFINNFDSTLEALGDQKKEKVIRQLRMKVEKLNV